MKKIFLLALIPAIMMSCQSKKEESKQDKEKEQTEKKDTVSDVEASTLSEVGQEVPSFSFTTVDGQSYSTEELKGKVVLLNFFATWCPSCMKEMPALQEQVWEKYKDEEDFLLVSLGREHTMEEMEKFKNEKPYTFHFAPDTGRVIYSHFAEKYIPRNILVGKDGKIIYQCSGYEKEEFNKMLEVLAKELG